MVELIKWKREIRVFGFLVQTFDALVYPQNDLVIWIMMRTEFDLLFVESAEFGTEPGEIDYSRNCVLSPEREVGGHR